MRGQSLEAQGGVLRGLLRSGVRIETDVTGGSEKK